VTVYVHPFGEPVRTADDLACSRGHESHGRWDRAARRYCLGSPTGGLDRQRDYQANQNNPRDALDRWVITDSPHQVPGWNHRGQLPRHSDTTWGPARPFSSDADPPLRKGPTGNRDSHIPSGPERR
jgi:hypothetical protein